MTIQPLLAAAAFIVSSLAFAENKPNFVITLGDDHGYYDSAPYGSKEASTPNLQSLADSGLLFKNAYVASPACAPSRAALFTGLMPYRNGIVGNHELPLKEGVRSLIPLLLDQGYEIAFRGKVGHSSKKHHKAYVPEEVHIIEGGKTTAINLPNVESFLKSRKDPTRPLALFIGFTDTHTPWPTLQETKIKPSEVEMPKRIYSTPAALAERSRYIQSIQNLDRKVGSTRRLAAKYLDPENTMIVYSSDHGMPWPFAKWSLYETGIRTPFIASWPGKIKPDTTADAWISWIDLMPTLIDLAGAKAPASIDGKSFAKVLFGETDHHRDVIHATHKGDKGHNVYPIRSVRVGDWKYILNLHPEFHYTTHTDIYGDTTGHGGHHWPSYLEAAKTDPAAAAFLADYHRSPAEELYNIIEDPFETNNLATSETHASKLAELSNLVDQYMTQVGDDKSISGKPRLIKDHPLPDPNSSPP